MPLYQNSRDIGKSIFFNLYKYYELDGKDDLFNKTKEVFNYLEKTVNGNKITDQQRLPAKKFLRIIFFLKLYHNKNLHSQLESATKELRKEIKHEGKSLTFPLNLIIHNS